MGRVHCLIVVCVVYAVFHGFGGRMAVSDAGMTPLNRIIDRCFKEIGLKQRDYNGRTHFGLYMTVILGFIPSNDGQMNCLTSCRGEVRTNSCMGHCQTRRVIARSLHYIFSWLICVTIVGHLQHIISRPIGGPASSLCHCQPVHEISKMMFILSNVFLITPLSCLCLSWARARY